MGHDVLAEKVLLPELSEGSLLTVSAIGAYNVSRGVSFIHRQPAAVLWDEERQSISLLRQAESFNDYIQNQAIPFVKRAKAS